MTTPYREATYPSNAPTMTDGSAAVCRDRALKTKAGDTQRCRDAVVQSNLPLCKPGKYGISHGSVSYGFHHEPSTVNPQLVVSGDTVCPEARKEALYPYSGNKATSEEGTKYRMSGCKVDGVESKQKQTSLTTKREFDEVADGCIEQTQTTTSSLSIDRHTTIPTKKISPIHRVWLRGSIADLNFSNLSLRELGVYLKKRRIGSNIPKSLLLLDISSYLLDTIISIYSIGGVSQIDFSWVAGARSNGRVDNRQPYLNWIGNRINSIRKGVLG